MNNIYNQNYNGSQNIINYEAFLKPEDRNKTDEKYTLTLFLAVFLGIFGVHRFLHKKYVTGIIMLLTGGGFLIWVFIDIYLIISRKFKNAHGQTLYYGGEFYENPLNVLAICLSIAIFSGWFNYMGTLETTTPVVTDENQGVQSLTTGQETLIPEVVVPIMNGNTIEVTEANKSVATSDLSGDSFTNNYAVEADIVVEFARIFQEVKDGDYNVSFQVRNNDETQTFTNVVLKITINGKDGLLSSHISTDITSEVFEPGESKSFKVLEHAYGEATDVKIEVVRYDFVE